MFRVMWVQMQTVSANVSAGAGASMHVLVNGAKISAPVAEGCLQADHGSLDCGDHVYPELPT